MPPGALEAAQAESTMHVREVEAPGLWPPYPLEAELQYSLGSQVTPRNPV